MRKGVYGSLYKIERLRPGISIHKTPSSTQDFCRFTPLPHNAKQGVAHLGRGQDSIPRPDNAT